MVVSKVQDITAVIVEMRISRVIVLLRLFLENDNARTFVVRMLSTISLALGVRPRPSPLNSPGVSLLNLVVTGTRLDSSSKLPTVFRYETIVIMVIVPLV